MGVPERPARSPDVTVLVLLDLDRALPSRVGRSRSPSLRSGSQDRWGRASRAIRVLGYGGTEVATGLLQKISEAAGAQLRVVQTDIGHELG
jgi:hypothetical protein